VAQVEAHGAGLSALSGGRNARALFEALFVPDLVSSLLAAKDEEATHQAIGSACDAYLGLLTAPRPKAELVAGVFPARGGDLGVAVVQRDGKLVHHAVVAPGENPVAAVEQAIGGHAVEGVVLPTTASDADVLQTLTKGFGPNLPVAQVKPVAMTEAQQQLEEQLPPPAAGALVLARRAVRPIKYWGQVDPVSLGLAEYQQDLDAERLRASLQDMYQLAVAGVKVEDASRPIGAPAAKAKAATPRVPAPPLNPLVKTVDDLRPGMNVNGVVTNVTQFGAFVNIGLSQEGLVHVSELADHFVKDPNEVVRVGQQVSVRVLGIDRGRGRISLSMKPERAPAPRREAPVRGEPGARVPLEPMPRRGGGGGGRDFDRSRSGAGTAASGPSRAQALAELEALFKKK
jgi:transcriptional accessory protein Tex/SPT6